MNAYQRLEERFGAISDVGQAISILNWDRAVIMPAAASGERGRQLATLEALAHEKLTDPKTADDLAEAENLRDLSPMQKANLREMRRLYTHAAAVPETLVTALSMKTTECEAIWREAKKKSDWKAVEKPLTEVLKLVREKAGIKAAALKVTPYNALLDRYDPCNTTDNIDRVFNDLEPFLIPFVDEVIAHQKSEETLSLGDKFDIKKQQGVALELAKLVGLDLTNSRLDVSAHPFCGGTAGDKRITTRYSEADFLPAMMGVIHETGHAMYDSNMPHEWRRQPAGDSMNMGMTIHESQSLICEMQLGCSPEFCDFIAPHYAKAFGGKGPAWNAQNLFRALTRVERSFIRVDADEVTYPLHIILRYRLEKDMIAGKLEIKDLPQAWNEGFKKLFGVVPPDHGRGCMQDIHWFEGYFGYFPTYALGAMTAAQFWMQVEKDVPGLRDSIRKGAISVFTNWLKEKIHAHGCLFTPNDLVRHVTGKTLDPEIFKAHLKRRYLGEGVAHVRKAG